jgi:hypothetical protein
MHLPTFAAPLSLAVALLLGCAGATPPSGAPPPEAQDAQPASGAAAAPDAPGAGASPSGSAAAAAPAAELPRAEPPAPLSDAEQKEAQSKCKPLLSAVQAAGKDDGKSPPERLREVLEKPPKMPPADLERCADLLGRGFRGYLFAAFEVEAKAILGRLARGMVSAYKEGGALCPGTDRPVPADAAKVVRAPYEPTAAEWDTPAWKCLQFSMEGQPLRFQYEVRTDPKALTFELIARGSPERDGKFIELVQRGSVKGGRVEIEGAARR